MNLTEDMLVSIYGEFSRTRARIFATPLSAYMNYYEINTPARASDFLAQIGHESGALRYTEEIASGEAYEGRPDLGNTEPGDGVRFKGRGLIQITGRANYERLSLSVGVDFIERPELLQQPEYAAQSACWYWNTARLNEVSDRPESDLFFWKKRGMTLTKFQWITVKINGGLTHYADRLAYRERARSVFNI